MSDAIITIDRLSKRYRIGARASAGGMLREQLADAARNLAGRFGRVLRGQGAGPAGEDFWALKDVSFEVKRGEVVGIIGRNGAGKSTLLKILSRITEPTSGRAVMRGRVGSLLEVGTGFHGELSGRDNIYLSGAILGMKKAEIDRKFDEIVAFSGVEKFLDTPIKRYSSGMNVRLGFAVAAHLDPEILLVDEVLAVGDAEFQKKCLGKMEEVSKGGRTILFVSHNMAAVQGLCSRAVVLTRGQVVCDSLPEDGVAAYIGSLAGSIRGTVLGNLKERKGDGPLRLTSVALLDDKGAVTPNCQTGKTATIVLDYRSEASLNGRNVMAAIVVKKLSGEDLFFCQSSVVGAEFTDLPSEGSLHCVVPRFPLRGGRYSLNLYVSVNEAISDWIVDGAFLEVVEGDYFGTGRMPPPGRSPLCVDHMWKLEARKSGGEPCA
ncbi:MAG TPA: ABC transporter ATP-binding protein [Planctomycetota bacterium]|nr:ABC transporter ATP-binding protein [Planctomycetota bacterium]